MGYVTGDCSLGNDLLFEIPSNYELGSLINKDGFLFNSTSGTITVYCDDYPEYDFRLPAMSGLTYRQNNYSYVDLPLTIDSGPILFPSASQVVLIFGLLISALIIICKGGAKFS